MMLASFGWFVVVRKAVLGMMAVHRMQDGAHSAPNPETDKTKQMKKELAEFKEESEQVSDWSRDCRGGRSR